ncbi:MAG: hypothetical protein JXD19_08190 [Deltaproteobacteria bacterium]|nr:hypothetical protein [Deltaproteobacteria bacterium]
MCTCWSYRLSSFFGPQLRRGHIADQGKNIVHQINPEVRRLHPGHIREDCNFFAGLKDIDQRSKDQCWLGLLNRSGYLRVLFYLDIFTWISAMIDPTLTS